GTGVRRGAVRARTAAGRDPVLRDPAGRHRPRKVEQALRRVAHALSKIQLRRHGRSALPFADRASGSAPSPARSRVLDGRHEDVVFAQKYPALMDIVVPMASLPTEMSGRNWMLRRLIIDSIRRDPEWKDGNYSAPVRAAQFASVFYNLATNGGNHALQKAAPTREKAAEMLDRRLSAPFTADANDVLYQWESSRDYNPSAGLDRIQATVLAVNSADDERNPPELGVLDREIKRVKSGRVFLIPASDQTAGHATTFFAKFWKSDVGMLLQTAPRLTK